MHAEQITMSLTQQEQQSSNVHNQCSSQPKNPKVNSVVTSELLKCIPQLFHLIALSLCGQPAEQTGLA